MQLKIYWDEKDHDWLYEVNDEPPRRLASTGIHMPHGAIKSDFSHAAAKLAEHLHYDADDFDHYRKMTVYHGREKVARFRYNDDNDWTILPLSIN
ncbi:hypothetical protein KS4_30900 [Poriferisphaera corsica]|uniref:Uncharacterized protein n=1 Tax=Poriferisphaera corsica TaxID=2528020 RepID=A0A517YXR0_9BACT|nr:hypothetical protein [Poriferisphaera corsica]QDU35013.1 hypothetical protein KS4_30900 [Poriferisphaera corsica]